MGWGISRAKRFAVSAIYLLVLKVGIATEEPCAVVIQVAGANVIQVVAVHCPYVEPVIVVVVINKN